MNDFAPKHVLVVGGGLAGVRTAENLRGAGYSGRLTLAGAELHLPYDRPPLSKQLLAGEREHQHIALIDETRRQELALDLLLGRRAVGLTLGCVQFDDGSEIEADAIVVATGVVPRRLPGQPPGAFTLRSVDEALALRSALRTARSVLVIGAGFVGGEVASTATAMGCSVTVVEAALLPLARVLGPSAGRLAARVMVEAGVDLRLGCGVDAIDPAPPAGFTVTLSDGQLVRADVVVVGVGGVPDLDWLNGSGLQVDNGIVCGPTGQAVGLPHVWALGDVASWEDTNFGRRRHEHWTSATEQAVIVACDILGLPAAPRPAPYVWSDQFGLRIQVLGHPDRGEDVVQLHGDSANGGPVKGTVLGHLAGERLIAVTGFGAPRLVTRYRGALSIGADRAAVMELARSLR